jgi:carbonic anhydrase
MEVSLRRMRVILINLEPPIVVHTKGSQLAVIGAFIDFANSTSPFIKQIVDNSNLAIGESKVVTMDYTNAVNAIKSRTQLYRYTGSLTTPPCTV